MSKKEMINHPSHYGGVDNPYEAIKVIEAWEADFNIGTTLRYLCRCGKKTIGGTAEEMRLEDLKKARWYLDREIKNIEEANKENKFKNIYKTVSLNGEMVLADTFAKID